MPRKPVPCPPWCKSHIKTAQGGLHTTVMHEIGRPGRWLDTMELAAAKATGRIPAWVSVFGHQFRDGSPEIALTVCGKSAALEPGQAIALGVAIVELSAAMTGAEVLIAKIEQSEDAAHEEGRTDS